MQYIGVPSHIFAAPMIRTVYIRCMTCDNDACLELTYPATPLAEIARDFIEAHDSCAPSIALD